MCSPFGHLTAAWGADSSRADVQTISGLFLGSSVERAFFLQPSSSGRRLSSSASKLSGCAAEALAAGESHSSLFLRPRGGDGPRRQRIWTQLDRSLLKNVLPAKASRRKRVGEREGGRAPEEKHANLLRPAARRSAEAPSGRSLGGPAPVERESVHHRGAGETSFRVFWLLRCGEPVEKWCAHLVGSAALWGIVIGPMFSQVRVLACGR